MTAPTVYLIRSLLGFAPHVPLPFLSAGPFSLLKAVPAQPQPLCPVSLSATGGKPWFSTRGGTVGRAEDRVDLQTLRVFLEALCVSSLVAVYL